MEIVNVRINDLKPAEYNPRKLTRDQHAQLKESLRKFGLVDPIIVNKHKDRENVVVGGHQRLKIAQELGYKDVPVVYVDLTLERERELNLRLNKNLGEWDWEMLANQFDLPELKEVGFTNNELGFMQDEGEEDGFDEEEELRNITTPESVLGEVYVLGEHRVMCGDSTNPEHVAALMDNHRARLLFTDPPYGVSYSSGAARGDKSKHDKIKNDDLSGEKLTDFLQACFHVIQPHLADDACFYVWHATSTAHLFREALERTGFEIHQLLIWLKSHFTLTRADYQHIYEPCFYGWQKGKKHFTNSLIRNLDDFLNLDFQSFTDALNVWFETRDKLSTYDHPTQKPVRLAGRAIRKSTEQDDVVVDIFGGSGSTLIAAEQMGRKAFIMELDPKYVDLIKRRYQIYLSKGTRGSSHPTPLPHSPLSESPLPLGE